MNNNFQFKQFAIITLLTNIWIQIAEIARAALVAWPRMTSFFGDRFQIIGPNEVELSHALIWFGWGTILTVVLVFIYWLCINTFGNNFKSVLITATVTTMATVGLFWIGFVNLGLGEWSTAFIILPLVLIELVLGAWIASKLYASGHWVN